MEVLLQGGEIQFFPVRLCPFSVCFAPVLPFAGDELVAAHGAQPSGVEGPILFHAKAMNLKLVKPQVPNNE
jgi:hypothetical protein